MLAILAASSPPIWPVIVVAIIGASAVFGSAVFAGNIQRKYNRDQRKDAEKKRQDEVTSANIVAQVDLTKDVLDNWKDIVRSLGQQISDLHGQVAALEERERKCQIELMRVNARLITLEGHLAPKTGGGNE